MFVAAFTDLNRIIVYATRFTDEIFALLIAAIFIINAVGNPFAPVGLYYYFDPHHKSHEKHEDDEDYSYQAAALLAFLVCIGTVQLAFILRKAKFSPFFPNQTFRKCKPTQGSLALLVVVAHSIPFLAFTQATLSQILLW
jgi:magnesium-transporting ATPase (P-type)